MKSKTWVLIAAALFFVGCSDDTSKTDAGPADGGADGSRVDGGGDGGGVDNVVTIASGKVIGAESDGVRSYFGIPFAAAPVGALRWKAPQPVANWKDPRDATKHGPSCPQEPQALFGPPNNFDEDCLSLSVWAPKTAKKLPVMVWIHGGGFILGGSASSLYDGKRLAASGKVIVVGINYRLGPLGAFAHPALGQGDGNFGLLDQQAALRWVKSNIAAFGGDPENVTIFGESAGAMSVCLHLVAPGSKDLFHRAVMQSGTCGPALSRGDAEAQGLALAKKLACDTAKDPIACLRTKKPNELNKALASPAGFFIGDGASWGPFVDGASLEEQPLLSIAANRALKLPVLLGANKNEGTLFVSLAKLEGITEAEYKTTMGTLAPKFGVKAADLLAKYPASSFATPADAMAEALGDAAFVCPARRLARTLSEAGAPTFLYHFVHAPIAYLAFPFYRATHTAEIPFVFGNYPLGLKFPATELGLNGAASGYWRRFAEKGDPSGGTDPAWPAYATIWSWI